MAELKQSDYKRFTQGDFNYEKAKSVEPVYFVYPNYIERLKEHKIPVSPDMQDKELTKFIQMAAPEFTVKKIPTVVRLKHINQEGEGKGQKLEYMIWYENWSGKDKNGHKVAPVSDLPKGIDKGVDFSRSTDSEGLDTFKLEDEFWLYTVPFSGDKLDEILQETNTDADSVQYICMGIRSYSGYSYDEFRNLSFAELEDRGRTGKVQQPVIPTGKNQDGKETIALIPHNKIVPNSNKQANKNKNDSK